MSASVRHRVGLVGAGYIAEHHFDALRSLPDVQVVGIVDIDHDKAREFSRIHGGPPVLPSLEAMTACGVDVVHVLTPPHTHAEVALAAMAAGADVLVEKPLATSVEDCDRLQEAATRYGRRVGVNHSLLTDPQVLRVRRWIREGRLGTIISAQYFCSSVYPEWSGGPLPPQYQDGGYPFRDLGVHGLYLLQELLGEIVSVDARFLSRGGDPNLYFDEWHAAVECATGSGYIYLTWNVHPLQTLLTVHGTRGSARADIGLMFSTLRRARPVPKAVERVWNAMDDALPPLWQVPANVGRFVAGRLRPYQGLRNFVRHFYDCRSSGQPFAAGLNEGRSVVRWLEHVARPADAVKAAKRTYYRTGGYARVVVTGASGYLGRHLVRRLLAEGQAVRVLVRWPAAAAYEREHRGEVVVGDLGDPEAVDIAVRGADVVYHLGATLRGEWGEHQRSTIGGTTNVIAACLNHDVRRLVYVSSLSVLDWAGLHGSRSVTEAAPLEPRPAERGFYTQAKLAAEQLVRDAVASRALPAVIVRPGQIFGPGTALPALCNAIAVGRWLMVLGPGRTILPLVHVEDVVDALLLAGQAGSIPPGTIYHVVDERAVTQRALAHRLAPSAGLRVIHVPNPMVLLCALALEALSHASGHRVPLTRYRIRSSQASLRFDCSKIRNELGWAPRVGIQLHSALTTDLASGSRVA